MKKLIANCLEEIKIQIHDSDNRDDLLLLSTRHCQQVTVNWLEANHIHNQRLNTNIMYITKI